VNCLKCAGLDPYVSSCVVLDLKSSHFQHQSHRQDWAAVEAAGKAAGDEDNHEKCMVPVDKVQVVVLVGGIDSLNMD